MLSALLMMSCAGPTGSGAEEDCESGVPPLGEVYAKRITCLAELPEGAEGGLNDWLLVNAYTRVIIRDATHRLTRLAGTGGTVIDASSALGVDGLTELTPLVGGDWPVSGEISAEAGGIVLAGIRSDGSDVTIRYTLDPQTAELMVTGANGFDLVPNSGSVLRGRMLRDGEPDLPLSVGSIGPITDHGGWLTFNETDTIALGDINDVARSLWPDHTAVEGTSNGDLIEVADAGVLLFTLPVIDEAFAGVIPSNAQLRSTSPGHRPGDWVVTGTSLNLVVGDGGFVVMQVANAEGTPIPATLTWNGQQHTIGVTPTTLAIGPEVGSGIVDAGPEYEVVELEEQSVVGTQELTVVLQAVADPAALIALDVPAFPDRTERRVIDDVLFAQAGHGVDYAVLTAGDEIAQSSGLGELPAPIQVHAGSRALSDKGSPFAWPWSLQTRAPAHGAAPWHELDPIDLLAVMSKGGRRFSAVDAEWVASAGPANNWSPLPDIFMLRSFDDLEAYVSLLDQWVPVSAAGALTWAEVETRNRTDMIRALLRGNTTATTGPRIRFAVDTHGPGSDLSGPFIDPFRHHEVVVDIQGRGTIEHAALIGPGGEIISSWIPKTTPHTISISEYDWVLAAVWGDTDWAVTSPVWLRRP